MTMREENLNIVEIDSMDIMKRCSVRDERVVWYLGEKFVHKGRHHLDEFPSQIRFHFFEKLLAVAVDEEVQRCLCGNERFAMYLL